MKAVCTPDTSGRRCVEHGHPLFPSGWCLAAKEEALPLILSCPACGERHIDEGEFETKIHHTHSCQRCGLTWRPAVVPTVGVRFLPGFSNHVARTPDLLFPGGLTYGEMRELGDRRLRQVHDLQLEKIVLTARVRELEEKFERAEQHALERGERDD